MPFVPLQIPPGVLRNGTRYQAKGRWYDADLVRWHQGVMRPIGGFTSLGTAPSSVLSLMHEWRANDGTPRHAFAAGSSLFVSLGGANAVAVTPPSAQTWRDLDNFGELLLAAAVAGKPYAVAGAATATALEDAPTCTGLVVTPERFLVLLGADGVANRVAWADQESLDDWEFANPNNQAGYFELQTQGTQLAARRSRSETLIWTEHDVWAMRYIGAPLVYSFQQLGQHCGTISRHAMAVVDGKAYWMGRNGFFAYDGYVRPVPCEVSEYVFGRINMTQASGFGTVRCVPVTEFNEIWWFYPAGNGENDSYVVYNYAEGHWATGSVGRTCGIDSAFYRMPLMGSAAGGAFLHEHPGGTLPKLPHAESGPFEIAEGDRTMMVRRLVPDEKTVGDTRVTFYAAQAPTGTETAHGPYTLSTFTDVRFSCRQVRLKIEQVNAGWRVGVPRLEVVPGSQR
jgi:hypothetical protein